MKTLLPAITLLSSLYCIPAFAANVELTFTDINHLNGELYVALYNSEEGMEQRQSFQRQIISVHKDDQKTILADLPAGQYGVMAFQDLDGNHDLNSNLLGIPTEPYGFSTNPSLMGPPDFNDIVFSVSDENVSLTISMD